MAHITAVTAGLIKGMSRRGDDQEKIASFFVVEIPDVREILNGTMFRNVTGALGRDLPPLKGTYPVYLARRALIQARTSIEEALAALDQAGETR